MIEGLRAFGPQIGCKGDCLRNGYDELVDLIESVVNAVSSAWEWVASWFCSEEEAAPLEVTQPSRVFFWESAPPPIPLIPEVLPAKREIPVTPCPAAPLDEHQPSLDQQRPFLDHILGEVRAARDASNYVRENRDRITCEGWVWLLGQIEISQQPVRVTWNVRSDTPRLIDLAVAADPESSLVNRIATLALAWVKAKKEGTIARPDPNHPFHEIFEALKESRGRLARPDDPSDENIFIRCAEAGNEGASHSGYVYPFLQLLALQELSRVLPLVRALAARKRTLLLESRDGFQEVRIPVCPCRNLASRIGATVTRVFTYNPVSYLISIPRPLIEWPYRMELPELHADKIPSFADTAWGAYEAAKANGDVSAFFKAVPPGTICFNARFTHFQEFLSRFAQNLDFVIDPAKLNNTFERRADELFRVFMNLQVALKASMRGLDYEELKERIQSRAENSQDPDIRDFFSTFLTPERFRMWLGTTAYSWEASQQIAHLNGLDMFTL